MAHSLRCDDSYFNFRYLPVGTIAWVKDAKNQVRQCKVIKSEWIETDDYNYLKETYIWAVAGLEGTYKGTSWSINGIGEICSTEKGAKLSIPSLDMLAFAKANIGRLLMDKYGLSSDCFVRGTYADKLTLRTWTVMIDDSVRLLETDFQVIITKDGIDVIVPYLEGSVDGKLHRFTTREGAEEYVISRSKKTITFDDEPEVKLEPELVKVTIEVDPARLNELKKIGKIIK